MTDDGGMEHFVPGADTQRLFRDALGCFTTGVAVITAVTGAGPTGMTANSFASVSLDPPLILWSPAKASRRHAIFAGADRFAVHVLGAHQLPVARHFAAAGDDFAAVAWETGAGGVPLLANCLARFECWREATHDAGDHVIVIGHVTAAAVGPGEPLIFARGHYGQVTQEA